jgi:hypothetical protein
MDYMFGMLNEDCTIDFQPICYMPDDYYLSTPITPKTALKNIKKIHISNGVTVIIDQNGSKTIVRVQNGEKVDKQKGLYMCLLKRAFSNKKYTEFCDLFRTSKPKYEKVMAAGILWHIYGQELYSFLEENGFKTSLI